LSLEGFSDPSHHCCFEQPFNVTWRQCADEFCQHIEERPCALPSFQIMYNA
jgi:hypothetical protein